MPNDTWRLPPERAAEIARDYARRNPWTPDSNRDRRDVSPRER